MHQVTYEGKNVWAWERRKTYFVADYPLYHKYIILRLNCINIVYSITMEKTGNNIQSMERFKH